jgi:putative lipoic acid-binding regulatory protein
MEDKEAFYKKLQWQLEDTTQFPSDYLFKFIVPTTDNQVEEVENLFNNKGAVINTKKSKTGKYVSVSIVLHIENAATVIEYYQKAAKIKGIISL